MMKWLLALIVSGFAFKASAICELEQSSDGGPNNQETGLSLKLGPPGAQNGHSNPIGIPPGPQDMEFTYLWRCGYELNISLVPGPTFGIRYRAGKMLYGSLGSGLLITANGVGPGVYAGFGMTVMRHWPVTFELDFKQAIGLGFGVGQTQIITPFAFRIGAGIYWE